MATGRRTARTPVRAKARAKEKATRTYDALALRNTSLPPPHVTLCEGGGDVVGVFTPLVGGVAQAFHDDQVVELRVQLAVKEVEGKEEDRKGQVEVEEEKRLKEVRSWMTFEMFMTRLRS